MIAVNAFSLRSVFLAKHAQHVVLIHFPIALFMTRVGFDLFSRGKRGSQFAGAAYLNLSLGALSVFPVAATDLLAWHFVLEGQRLKGILLCHLIAASTAMLLLIASWWVHWRAPKTEPWALPGYRIPIELLGVAGDSAYGGSRGFFERH